MTLSLPQNRILCRHVEEREVQPPGLIPSNDVLKSWATSLIRLFACYKGRLYYVMPERKFVLAQGIN